VIALLLYSIKTADNLSEGWRYKCSSQLMPRKSGVQSWLLILTRSVSFGSVLGHSSPCDHRGLDR